MSPCVRLTPKSNARRRSDTSPSRFAPVIPSPSRHLTVFQHRAVSKFLAPVAEFHTRAASVSFFRRICPPRLPYRAINGEFGSAPGGEETPERVVELRRVRKWSPFLARGHTRSFWPLILLSCAPIFLGLPLHRRCRRVLALNPVSRAAGDIGRAEPLRHDASLL
jgi:hypothetical protein